MLQTDLISYNLKDRGRKYRGKERDFDIPALVKAINSPECQERVKKRDMLGFYGHWPRMKFGLYPAEGGIQQGKAMAIEPAIVTTFLKAYSDGTVEHRAEFLDTDAGKLAQKLFQDRVGGFSSAIDQGKPEFFGFDYVLEPNYSTNRGWALDCVQAMPPEQFEAAIYGEQIRGVMVLLDKVTSERDLANETIEHLRAENADLIAKAAQQNRREEEALRAFQTRYVSLDTVERLEEDTALFKSMEKLPRVEEPEERSQPTAAEDSLYGRILRRYI